MTELIDVRRVFTHVEEIHHEFGPAAQVPLVRGAIAAVLRQIIQREVVGPASAQFPWLDGSFVVIEP